MSTSERSARAGLGGLAAVSDDLAARVALLEDERDVRSLVARIAHLADWGDLDEYISCFTEDSVWEWLDVRNEGAEAIRADRTTRRAAGQQGPGSGSRHVVTTQYVEVDGSDVARAQSYLLYIVGITTNDGPSNKIVNRYDDSFRRTPDGWKLAHRRCLPLD
jgi:ketosteroid isomerase-like protein